MSTEPQTTDTQPTDIVAYCWASGLIEFGQDVPEGARLIIKGPEHKIRLLIEARASCHDHEYLVPHIRLANNINEACRYFVKFQRILQHDLTPRSPWPVLVKEPSPRPILPIGLAERA